MSIKREKFCVILILLCLLIFFPQGYGFPEQDEEKDIAQLENAQEKIVPAPQNLRERIGIYVFLGWMWLVVCVAMTVLRLKIKEADRLHAMKFFSDEKK